MLSTLFLDHGSGLLYTGNGAAFLKRSTQKRIEVWGTDIMEPLLKKPKKALNCPNCGASVAEDCVSCEFCHSTLSITACPSCFGAVFKGMKFCPSCGAAVERSETESDKKLACPRCEKDLVLADIGGTIIHECGICGGIWLVTEAFQKICVDRDQQDRIIVYPSLAKPIEREPDTRPKKFYVPCPECGELMNQKNFAGCSGILIDSCKSHGVWLDRQELQKIINFIKDGGLQKAREMELGRLKAEQKRLEAMKHEQNLASLTTSDRTSFLDSNDHGVLIDDVFAVVEKIIRYFDS